MKAVFAIDPGPTQSAYVMWEENKISNHAKLDNEQIHDVVRRVVDINTSKEVVFAIEHMQCFGMPVGAEVFETAYFIGELRELIELAGFEWKKVMRSQVKMHHCHNMRAKDANIRAALIDKYGPPGVKKSPGVTYGLSGDMWSAFAIATYISETMGKEV